jgi:hypothetical protein
LARAIVVVLWTFRFAMTGSLPICREVTQSGKSYKKKFWDHGPNSALLTFGEITLPDRRLGNEVVVHAGKVFLFVVAVLAQDEAEQAATKSATQC